MLDSQDFYWKYVRIAKCLMMGVIENALAEGRDWYVESDVQEHPHLTASTPYFTSRHQEIHIPVVYLLFLVLFTSKFWQSVHFQNERSKHLVSVWDSQAFSVACTVRESTPSIRPSTSYEA